MAGRKPKPEGEKYIRKDYKLPPALVRRIEQTIPASKRSKFIAMAAEHSLDILAGGKGMASEIIEEFQE